MIAGLSEIEIAVAGEKWSQPQRGRVVNGVPGADDINREFSEALESPVGDQPPLSQTVFAGDRIAVVLQADLPQAPLVVDILLRRLMETNIEPTDITVVIPPLMAEQFGLDSDLERDQANTDGLDFKHPLDDELLAVNFVLHDADDEQGLAYIAASEEGLAIKVNRAIVDADVIIPVGYPRVGDELADCVYPEFATEETRQRFHDCKNSIKSRKAEIELANDCLGVFFSIQLVAGAGGKIIDTKFGQRTTAIERAAAESNQVWSIDPVDQAEMAIATIETDPSRQTWKDFANALVAANSMAASSGPIVIWSAIGERPKSEIRKALNEPFESASRTKLSRLMQRVAGIVEERQVFLKSELSQSVVEELGLGYVAKFADIARLLEDQSSGVFLRDAHLCQVKLNLENVDAQ